MAEKDKTVNPPIDSQKQKHMQALLRHINLVQDGCELLGNRFIEQGEAEFGKILIANGFLHDNSKFYGIEWEHLTRDDDDSEKLKLAFHQHVTTNHHHAEFWGGIKMMPRVRIAEMVCDWYARSIEFGTDLRKWVKEEALNRYGISPQGKEYKVIKECIDLLLETPFGKIR